MDGIEGEELRSGGSSGIRTFLTLSSCHRIPLQEPATVKISVVGTPFMVISQTRKEREHRHINSIQTKNQDHQNWMQIMS